MRTFGIIGYPLSHSFSSEYFSDKFEDENIDAQYINFPIKTISEFSELVKSNPDLAGLNVTMPYKEQIIPFIDELNLEAKETGAVNLIKILKNGDNFKLIGYNTDVYGFEKSLKPLLKSWHNNKALILGTGGAAKAVKYVLSSLGMESNFVSRFVKGNNLVYRSLTPEIIKENKLIINATPVGMNPDNKHFPDIPYKGFSEEHLAYDLIYNPVFTQFLRKAERYGATIKNGREMFVLQAKKSWEIWNSIYTITN